MRTLTCSGSGTKLQKEVKTPTQDLQVKMPLYKLKKKERKGALPLVQWLRYKGHWFDPWSAKIPRAKGQLNPSATTTEAHVPQSLCSATRGATAKRSPPATTREEPPARESPRAQQRRPSKAKNKVVFLKIFFKKRKKICRTSMEG